jgi:hypothetical protein
MIKYVLPAAIAALALGAPAVHAQMAQPMPAATPNPNTTNVSATITGQPQPGPTDRDFGLMQPVSMMVPYFRPISPRTTWIPGHYDWDPNASNYVYIEGQYVEAPRENVQWISGHWVQTPTAWIWIAGGWN